MATVRDRRHVVLNDHLRTAFAARLTHAPAMLPRANPPACDGHARARGRRGNHGGTRPRKGCRAAGGTGTVTGRSRPVRPPRHSTRHVRRQSKDHDSARSGQGDGAIHRLGWVAIGSRCREVRTVWARVTQSPAFQWLMGCVHEVSQMQDRTLGLERRPSPTAQVACLGVLIAHCDGVVECTQGAHCRGGMHASTGGCGGPRPCERCDRVPGSAARD